MNSVLLQIDLSPLNKYECGGKQALFKSVSAQAFLRPREVINLQQREPTSGLEEVDTNPGKSLLDLHQIFPRVEKCTFCSAYNHEGLWMPRRSLIARNIST